jgi:hypothetical protein
VVRPSPSDRSWFQMLISGVDPVVVILIECLFVISCTSLWPCHKIGAPTTFFECSRSIGLRQELFGLHFLCRYSFLLPLLLSNILLVVISFFYVIDGRLVQWSEVHTTKPVVPGSNPGRW